MGHVKKIPVLVYLMMTDTNYLAVTNYAYTKNQSISQTLNDLVELGLLTLQQYNKDMVVDITEEHPHVF